MRFSSSILLAVPTLAFPTALGPRAGDANIKPWKAAGPDDSRGPCPMMNTLANHGYLPHNGRNISVDNIADAIFAATNWSRDFGLIPGAGAFAALGVAAGGTIELKQLDNRTAGIERPASLARPDDSNTVSPPRVDAVLADSADPQYISAASLGASRRRLEKISPLTEAQQSPARGEAAFIVTLLLDGDVPDATADAEGAAARASELRAFKDYTRVFLAEERLPVELGWKPSKRLVQLADMSPVSAAIAAAQKGTTS
ncbi:Cloroperoxidase [Apiospora rasikravindrae]|uniref:Cloroperoxidase n=1 Tax=Apiospora rasikravindrae TaxID=990691 RepID=A0ABR1SWK5_9PEZI